MADGTLVFDTKLDTDGVKTGLSGIGSVAKTGLGVAAAGFAAVTTAAVATTKALADGVAETAAYGDNIDKMSQKMGVSTDAYQEWDFVMQHCGTSIEALKPSMKTLANAAVEGKDEFEKLGISQKELATLSQEDLFALTISRLQEMEEGTERTAIASKLLGKGATELGPLLNMTAEETAAMRDQVHDLGGVMSEDAVKASAAFQDSLQNMQTAFAGLKRGMTAELLPAVTQVTDGLTKLFSGNKTEGLEQIKQGVDDLSQKLMDLLPTMVELGGEIIMSLCDAIVQNLPTLIDSGMQIVNKLIEGIIQALPQLLQGAMQIIKGLVDALIENLPMIVKVGLELIVELAKGIAQALPTLIPQIVDVVLEIVDTLLDNIDMLIDAGIELIIGLATGLVDAIPKLIEKLPTIITKLVEGLIRNAPKLVEASLKLMVTLAEGLIKAIPEVLKAIPKIITGIWDALKNAWPQMKEAGLNLIKGLGEGISNATSWLIGKIKSLCSNALGAIKSFFGIASPSKKFKWIGEMCVEGMEEGLEDMDGVADGVNASLGNITANVSGGYVGGATNGGLAAAVAEVLQGMGVYMDGRAVGSITAEYVDTTLGRFAIRRV